MALSIKNFTVLNTTTGKMAISGRFNSTILNTILSFYTYNNNVTDEVAVPGTPSVISSGGLLNKAHMSTTYIKIIKTLSSTSTVDTIYIPDNYLRISYIGGLCMFDNTVLYGFTNNLNTTDITWNVLFASTKTQTYGDYVDIELPNPSSYPTMYIAFILLVKVWETKTIVNGNVCSISSTNAVYNYCIDPSKSYNDVNNSHFIVMQGKNIGMNMFSHLIIGCEDNIFNYSDRDYNDVILSLSSRFLSDTQLNDTSLN